jgi:hypothetical protein
LEDTVAGTEHSYPPDHGFEPTTRESVVQTDDASTEDNVDLETRLLRLSKEAERQSTRFMRENLRSKWEANYKAFRSEYTDTSKYRSDDFRHRSKIFRPKTRIALSKDLGAAAQSLFSTVEAVSVAAGDETDPMQQQNAELQKALINYRLDRTSGQNAVSWFLTSMGARQDSQITGICISKQYWNFQEREVTRMATQPDPITGKPIEVEVTEKIKLKDKPEIDLIAPENIRLHPAAHWIDPVQSGAYFGVAYPMTIQAVKDMCADPRTKWKEIAEQDFSKAKVRDFDSSSTRRAREGGTDRLDNTAATSSSFDIVWVFEWFIYDRDVDWCFWTIGTEALLSTPMKTEEAYPWKGGDRPYRMGYGNLESHRIAPQSPVETWQPLQAEINDMTNLSLDVIKQVLNPVAKVKRGRKIDMDALKKRYPVLLVDDPEGDVVWDRPPEGAATAFAERSRLDTDFDDLAGVFTGGTVANNRQVGETLGGMRLMNAASNAVTEFQVRVWVETWVEPVLADLAKLEAYYESDEKILALAKKRANARLKYGIDKVTDELLNQEVLVRVSAGVGSPDPMQKLGKLGTALQMAAQIFQASPKFMSGELRVNEEALLDEILGNAGYRDGFARFFVEGEPMQQPGQEQGKPGKDPAEIEAEMQNNQADRDATLANSQADRESKEKIAAMGNKTKITQALMQARARQREQERGHEQEGRHALAKFAMDTSGRDHDADQRERDRTAAAKQRPAA